MDAKTCRCSIPMPWPFHMLQFCIHRSKQPGWCGIFHPQSVDCIWLACQYAKSLQSCPTLGNPMDCIAGQAPLRIHGILQARMECVAVPSSRGFSRPRDRNRLFFLLLWQGHSSPLAPPGKEKNKPRIRERAVGLGLDLDLNLPMQLYHLPALKVDASSLGVSVTSLVKVCGI